MNQTRQPTETEAADTTIREEKVASDGNEILRREEQTTPRRRIHPGLIAAAVIAAVLLFFLAIWYFSGSTGEAGRPVPAPRSSMSDMPTETLASQTITLSPEQVHTAGIEIGTVGEHLTTESTESSATGTVEANAYRQTPAVTLVGGVVRRVVPELGANVSAGQTVAVIFSDEFAQTQSRYIALQTEAQNARRSYERSQSLVTINQPGRSELEQAIKQRRAAEAALSEMQKRYARTTRLMEIGAASREELEQDNTKLRSAEADLEEAQLREERAYKLLPISPEVRSASEEALNKLRSSESDLAATRQRLILYGLPASRVDSLRSPA